VTGDRSRLRQVLWNLLVNALKFTPPGGSVSISTTNTPGGRLRIAVRDSGAGMDTAELESLFDPFERYANGHESRGGLGLGLAICKGLIAAHDGQLFAASEGPGRGSTFAIELATVAEPVVAEPVAREPVPRESVPREPLTAEPPVRAGAPAAGNGGAPSAGGATRVRRAGRVGLDRGADRLLPGAAAAGEEPPAELEKQRRAANGGSAPRRVLIVEDDRDSAALMALFLSHYGYDVAVASTLAGGLDRLAEGWDIVLSDLGLPDGSGLDIARRARRLPHPPRRLVAFSGHGFDEDVERSRQAGFDEHVVKPVALERLLQSLGDPPAPPQRVR
jgi:CheY-like chemotaxis protein